MCYKADIVFETSEVSQVTIVKSNQHKYSTRCVFASLPLVWLSDIRLSLSHGDSNRPLVQLLISVRLLKLLFRLLKLLCRFLSSPGRSVDTGHQQHVYTIFHCMFVVASTI